MSATIHLPRQSGRGNYNGEQKIRKPTFPGQEKREKGEYRETGRPRNRVFRLNLFINKFGLFMPPLNRWRRCSRRGARGNKGEGSLACGLGTGHKASKK